MREWVSVAENKNPRAHRGRWAASHHQEIWTKPTLLCEGARLLIRSANKPPALSPTCVCASVCSGMCQHVCMRASRNARRGNDRMEAAIAGFSDTEPETERDFDFPEDAGISHGAPLSLRTSSFTSINTPDGAQVFSQNKFTASHLRTFCPPSISLPRPAPSFSLPLSPSLSLPPAACSFLQKA